MSLPEKKLSRREKSLINVRAYELGRKAEYLYRVRLMEMAQGAAARGVAVTDEWLSTSVPQIDDDMRPIDLDEDVEPF